MLSDGLTRRPLTEGIRTIYKRGFSGCLEDICENVARVNDSVFVHVAPNQIRDLLALCLQSVVQLVKRVLRAAKIFSEIGKEDFHWLQSSSVQNCYDPLMFEVDCKRIGPTLMRPGLSITTPIPDAIRKIIENA